MSRSPTRVPSGNFLRPNPSNVTGTPATPSRNGQVPTRALSLIHTIATTIRMGTNPAVRLARTTCHLLVPRSTPAKANTDQKSPQQALDDLAADVSAALAGR